jgi:diguanylate cyclase (GGDEF)-like protein
MTRLPTSDFLMRDFWAGWRRWAAWTAYAASVLLLGKLRSSSHAEFSTESLALLPVIAIAWLGGQGNGLIAACIAALTWLMEDIFGGYRFSSSWIQAANAATHLTTYSLVAFLVSKVRLQIQREHEQATRDVLTGLLNRRAFFSAGAIEVERSRRYEHPLAVFFLDLDHFKLLNDTRGHEAGDLALRKTADSLLASLRSTDQVCRLGGDEFAALLPEIGYDEAIEAGKKIAAAVNKALADFPPVTASIGLAWFGADDRNFPEMVKVADKLMYEAKTAGKSALRSQRFPAGDGATRGS